MGKNWTYPLKQRALEPIAGSARHFGAEREGTNRIHAGVDLITDTNGKWKVYACTSGKVYSFDTDFFKDGVGQITIKNDDGSWIRYGECNATNLRVGQAISQGQEIGYVPSNGKNAMIHFEVYAGDSSGELTDTSNSSNYLHVTPRNYQRRPDLVDPTFVENLPIFTG